MKATNRLLRTIASLAVLAAPQYAGATGITMYDQSLATAGGWYQGTGNPNGGFTLVQDDGVEIALRAKHRQDPNVIHTSSNLYQVQAGPQSPSVTNRAWWNYEFGVDLSGTTLVLADVAQFSTMTIQDLTAGASNTVNFLNGDQPPGPGEWNWVDYATWGPSGEQQETLANQAALFATNWGAQNSQNPVFGDFPLLYNAGGLSGYTYNMYAAHTYRITIDLRDASNQLLASNSIDIQVVPEPASLTLMGVGLLTIAALRRRWHQRSPARRG